MIISIDYEKKNKNITFLLFLYSFRWDVKCDDDDKRTHLCHHLFLLNVMKKRRKGFISYVSYNIYAYASERQRQNCK